MLIYIINFVPNNSNMPWKGKKFYETQNSCFYRNWNYHITYSGNNCGHQTQSWDAVFGLWCIQSGVLLNHRILKNSSSELPSPPPAGTHATISLCVPVLF